MSATQTTIGGPDRAVTVHEAHAGRMPPLRDYLADTWRRRRFVAHLARSNLKAAHSDTLFGQLWQVLNPLLLGLVYFMVVQVLRQSAAPEGYLAYIMGGLFLYYYVRNAMGTGANAVVSGGALLLNTAFPRVILPLATTLAATYNYLPSFLVYLAFHLAGGQDLHPTMLLLPFLSLAPLVVFALGMAMISATITVYFRDTTSFLPYLLRIWLYLSPVLLTFDDIVGLVDGGLKAMGIPAATAATLAPRMAYINPMVAYLRVWHALVGGTIPVMSAVVASIAWSVVALLIGVRVFLVREREFAFRV